MNYKFTRLILELGKIIIALSIGVILMADANAFKVQAFGWEVAWNDRPLVVDSINKPYFERTMQFDEEIAIANSRKEPQLFLKELDYRRIGLVDVSNGETHTILISDEGIIQGVEIGLNEPETIVRADLPMIEELISEGNFRGIKSYIWMPFRMKLKIMLMRWF